METRNEKSLLIMTYSSKRQEISGSSERRRVSE